MKKHFTIHRDPAVDRRIETDLSRISHLLLEKLGGCRALVLVGGFGRGEGSVLLENGRVEPVNDYDIVVVNGKTFDREQRRSLELMLSREVGIRYVDLIPRTQADLDRLSPTMFNYDLKYGGHVFYGDAAILDSIPGWEEDAIPLTEGFILLMNRLYCLLESFSMDFLTRSLNPDELFFLKFQCAKTVLGCCDALLLLKGRYHQSYSERSKRFRLEFSGYPEWQELVSEATDFKLKPSRHPAIDAVSCWFRTRSFFMKSFRMVAHALYGKTFRHWNDLCAYHGSNLKTVIKRAAYLVLRRSRNFEKRLHLELAQMTLIGALDRNGVDRAGLERARRHLHRVTGRSYRNLSWEVMRKECVAAWTIIHHGTET